MQVQQLFAKHLSLPKLMLTVLALLTVWLSQVGCAKEYSFEGADTVTATININPGNTAIVPVSNCPGCKQQETLAIGQWNFIAGNHYYCGVTENAGFIGTNVTFTLFGPSTCSPDSGLVMTVYMPVPLAENTFNLAARHAAFYYYDHNGPADMYISRADGLFAVQLTSYLYDTRIATGTFAGNVYTPGGDTVYVEKGNFKVRLK